MRAPESRFLVLNLDDSLAWQERLLALPHAWVNLTQVKGKKSCATPESLAAIEAALMPYRKAPLCFWGAGDYHYVTLARLRLLRRPLTLILFDHHHDCAPVQDGVITCGDWVRHALDLPWVRQVVWVGGKQPELWSFRPHPRLVRVSEPAPPAGFAPWAARAVPTPYVYISIDKDVLAPQDALTNWGAGDLPLADLLAWLRLLGQHRQVIGADVGGEWPLPPGQVVPSLGDWRAIRLNEAANLAIREALAPALHGQQWDPAGRTG
jgi:hypothetical protein